MALFRILLAPVLFAALLGLALKKQGWKSARPALFVFLVILMTGLWAVVQAHGEQAGIALLFLPSLAALGAVFPLAASLLLGSRAQTPITSIWPRWILWGALAVGLFPAAWNVVYGIKNIRTQRERELGAKAEQTRVADLRREFQEFLVQRAGREEAAVIEWLDRKNRERAAVIVALESDHVPSVTLSELAKSDDAGILLAVANNPWTPREALLEIRESAAYAPYFDGALASNPNTPPELLQELFQKKSVNLWIAKNKNSPAEILIQLSKSSDLHVVQSLLGNPSLTCEMLENATASLAKSSRPQDEFSNLQIKNLRPKLCR